MKYRIRDILLGALMLISAVCAQASQFGQTNFIVQALSTSPEFVQTSSQDLLLREGDDGSTYLYVEQGLGATLAIFDVTNPEHMRLIRSVRIDARDAYDFVAQVGSRAELITFRDGSGNAVLDFHKAKSPRMTAIEGLASVPTEILGTSGYLSSRRDTNPTTSVPPSDIQLVETDRTPHLLATVVGVTKRIDRPETGTIFLIGEGRVTVIRRLDVEKQYGFQKALNSN